MLLFDASPIIEWWRPCKLEQQVKSSIGMVGGHQIANSAEPRQDVSHILGRMPKVKLSQDKRYFGNSKIIHIEESHFQQLREEDKGGGAFGCQTRLEESSPQQLSNASFLRVVISDTPQCSYCLPEKTIMTLVPMIVDIPRSQIIAFNVRLRLPSHAAKVGIHVATALKDSQVAQRKEFWSGAPRTCACNLGYGKNAILELEYVFYLTFGTFLEVCIRFFLPVPYLHA